MRGGVEELPINEIEVVAFEEEAAGGGGPYEIDAWIDEMLDQYETDEAQIDSNCAFVAEHEGEWILLHWILMITMNLFLNNKSHFPYAKS